MDLAFSRVDNGFVLCSLAAGLSCRLVFGGPRSLFGALLGALIPLLAMGWLFALRMLGAGDLKLLMALGTFLDPGPCLRLLLGSLLWGAVLSLAYLWTTRSLLARLSHLAAYLSAPGARPYRQAGEREGTIPFALAILGSCICIAGGLL